MSGWVIGIGAVLVVAAMVVLVAAVSLRGLRESEEAFDAEARQAVAEREWAERPAEECQCPVCDGISADYDRHVRGRDLVWRKEPHWSAGLDPSERVKRLERNN